MTHPGTHFEREAEDQSILQFHGQLDRRAAERLWQEALGMTNLGYHSISADLSACTGVLAEGVWAFLEFQEAVEDTGCELWLSGLSDTAIRDFQIYGIAVQNRRARLRLPCGKIQAQAGFVLNPCPSCGVTLRLRRKGAHLCPRCGTRFGA